MGDKKVAYLNVRKSQLTTVVRMQERYGENGAIEIGYTNYSIDNCNKIQPHMIYSRKNQYRNITQSYEKTKREVYDRNFVEIANKAQNMIDRENTRAKLEQAGTKIIFSEDYVNYE